MTTKRQTRAERIGDLVRGLWLLSRSPETEAVLAEIAQHVRAMDEGLAKQHCCRFPNTEELVKARYVPTEEDDR